MCSHSQFVNVTFPQPIRVTNEVWVTVRVHSNETGDAKTAENFAGVNEVLQFAPYQEEVSLTPYSTE